MNDLVQNNQISPQTIYKPSEIIGIFNSFLAQQSVNAKIVYLRGIYLTNQKQGNWSYCYDTLKDEDSQEELTLQITHQQRENLKNGNLVSVGGVLNRSVSAKGFIQIFLKVSRIEVVKEQAIDEEEIKRIELRQKKASIGFKNVDAVLEGLLFTDVRPHVSLIFPTTSIAMSDFQEGINAAKTAIDFDEHRVNFSNATELTTLLKRLDGQDNDVIALVRGGGSGIENLDNLKVLETIVNLGTPTIAAIGHVEEKIFIKQLVDKVAPTPNGLGQYFSEMVERVNEKKNHSKAVLTEQIRKQFKQQIEAGQKQNKELQDKLKSLTETQNKTVEAQKQATKKHTEQVQAAQKQNKELQEKLKVLTIAQEKAAKAQEEANKKHAEQLDAAQKQNKSLQEQLKTLNENQVKQQEQNKKQQDELGKNLTKMQEANTLLQKSIKDLTNQNTQSLKELSQSKERNKELEHQLTNIKNNYNKNHIWMFIAIISIIFLILVLIIK